MLAKLAEEGDHCVGSRACDLMVGAGMSIPHRFEIGVPVGSGYLARDEDIGMATVTLGGETALVCTHGAKFS